MLREYHTNSVYSVYTNLWNENIYCFDYIASYNVYEHLMGRLSIWVMDMNIKLGFINVDRDTK